MKKWVIPGILALLLLMTGCGRQLPSQAADGSPWDENWTTMGSVLGIETPEGWILRRNEDVLTANGMFYATWSSGEASTYLNKEEQEIEFYDGQIHLLLAEYDTPETAEENVQQWMAMAAERYVISESFSESCNGQEYAMACYTFKPDTNPYSGGVCAVGTFGRYAVNVELSWGDGLEGDPLEILRDFLEHCHYAA